MTNPEVAILMLCMFIVLVLLGFPIAFTLIAMGVGFGYYAYYQGAPESFTDIFNNNICLLYTSPSPRDRTRSRMPSSA